MEMRGKARMKKRSLKREERRVGTTSRGPCQRGVVVVRNMFVLGGTVVRCKVIFAT